MVDLLIKNATIVTVNQDREILENSSLVIEDNKIIDLGPAEVIDEQYQSDKVIDATGKIIFPGLINTHNHLFQNLLKGLGDDRVLSDWLVESMLPAARKLTREDAYWGAMVGILDGLHSGTTTVLDYMHAHPGLKRDDGVIKAFKKTGIRGVFGRGYFDAGEEFGVPEELIEDIETIEKDCRRLLNSYHNTENNRIRIWIAPAVVWGSSKESLIMTRELAKEFDTNITVHVSETNFDRESTIKLHGKNDVEVLEELDILNSNCLLVHCVHLTDRDIDLIHHYDARISHNPVSNMYLTSGVAPIPKLLEREVTVGLASDGAASNNSNDMLEVLKITPLLHKINTLNPRILKAHKVLEMATIDAAKALGMEKEIGSIEKGKKADLFIFNPYLSSKAVPVHNPVSTLVYSASRENIETVIVDGKIIVEKGEVRTVDEMNTTIKAQEVAINLRKKAGIEIDGLVTRHMKGELS